MAEPTSSAAAGKHVDRTRPPAVSDGRPGPWVVVLAGWILPGAGHLLLGLPRKGAIFLPVLIGMTAVGLAFGGRLFAFQVAEPLVFLASVAQWALAAPRLVAAMAGWGSGRVVDATYEYGNTFLIVAGLLNVLVILDAFDRARGRRRS
jgi:hypothetical protein